jgi:hypothetical protein
MTPQSQQQAVADPWRNKGERYWLIASAVFLACLAFAAFDGKSFYARYMNLCTEQPDRAECRPLNLVKEVPKPDPGVTLDYGKGKWALEIGTRQEEGSANDLAARLRSSGIEPRLIRSSGKGKKTWYQVQIGRFPNRKGAADAGTQLQMKGLIQDFRLADYLTAR